MADQKPLRFGVLTEGEIADRLALPIGEPRSLVITPTPAEADRDKDSIDLRLGSCFFVPRAHRSPCFIPGMSETLYLYSEEYIPYGSYLVLPAHHTVLGATLEYIKLPSDVAGQILTKSSWARTFITIETAPWIHPLYRGCLTLEIANVSNTPIILYPGVKIAQLVLLKTMYDTAEVGKDKKEEKEDKIEGTYVGPVRPEPAELKPPREALGHLRIKPEDMSYPFDECFGYEGFRNRAIEYLERHGYNVEKGET